jgi:hypothetical protein
MSLGQQIIPAMLLLMAALTIALNLVMDLELRTYFTIPNMGMVFLYFV